MKTKTMPIIGLLAISTSMLFGCTGNNSSSSSINNSNSSEFSSVISSNTSNSSTSNGNSDDINKYLLSDVENGFSYAKGEYLANNDLNSMVFTTPIETGVFSSEVTYTVSNAEHYMIFNYNKSAETYYAFGINNNNLVLSTFDGSNLEVIEVFETNVSNTLELKIKFFEVDDVYELYFDDKLIFSNTIAIDEKNYLGIYSSAKSTKFSNIYMDTNPFRELDNYEKFTMTSGSSTIKEGGLQMTGKNNLAVHNDVSLVNGSFETTINVQDAEKNAVGIVFRLDDSNKTKYFKNQVPCYFLHFGITGSLTLVKHPGDGTVESLKYYVTPFFQKQDDHVLRVVLNEGMIHVLLDGTYCFGYEDLNPIMGDKIGYCSFNGNGLFKNLKVVATDDLLERKPTKYEVVQGEFTTYNDLTISTQGNSKLVSKEKIGTNGTLSVKIGTIDKHGHGLMFRLTKEGNSAKSFYFVENVGDQYYRLGKFENGNVTYSKKSYVATSIGHGGTVKVIMNNNDIYVYFTNRLVIKYTDPNPLMGEYYGYKCTYENGLFQGNIEYSESTEIDKADYLIFGHSYTNLWLSYKEDFKELGDSVLDVGIGGARTLHYVTTAPEMAAYNPKWGIYWNGINDVNADIALSTMPINIENTMKTIKEVNPDFQCVIIGINRCTYAKSVERYDQIHKANLLYKELCDKYDWLHFLDVEYLYCNEEGIPQKIWFVDDLHPTLAAYAKVAKLIVNVIKENEK